MAGFDGGGQVAPLAGAEGERRALRVFGVADGDVVPVWSTGEHRELDAASAGSEVGGDALTGWIVWARLAWPGRAAGLET